MTATGQPVDYSSPSLDLSFDLRTSPYFVKDDRNFLLYQTAKQLPVMQGLSLVDTYLSRGHSIEPHWHPNANELIYTIEGEIVESILNPFTLELLNYRLGPRQSVYIPQGWWHWTLAVSEHTRFVVTFDHNKFEIVYGSDILRITPPEVLQAVYGINAGQWAEVTHPIDQTVIIGPPEPNSKEKRWRIGTDEWSSPRHIDI
ncbi:MULTISPECIES: cupin domain-containing protein [Paenibacillus]|uniref:cupin domain-containing protein n=1 Tax=Paenibacillus TaxID=44249 RepID=UPI0022B8E40F|nr:cupin domain-containing protein [Paenibacillus caseinilyticus]MCZ8521082.1 cupin domain-containing protein [Paenibacillus caseinilyticus]